MGLLARAVIYHRVTFLEIAQSWHPDKEMEKLKEYLEGMAEANEFWKEIRPYMVTANGIPHGKPEEAEEEEMVNKGIEILKEMPWNKGKGQNKNRGREI